MKKHHKLVEKKLWWSHNNLSRLFNVSSNVRELSLTFIQYKCLVTLGKLDNRLSNITNISWANLHLEKGNVNCSVRSRNLLALLFEQILFSKLIQLLISHCLKTEPAGRNFPGLNDCYSSFKYCEIASVGQFRADSWYQNIKGKSFSSIGKCQST